MKAVIRFHAVTCSCDQMPASQGVMRPSGETLAASVKTSPAPPTARLPRCTRCQSFGTPSCAEYWHMGETKTRLAIVTERSVRGLKRRDMGGAGEWSREDAI